MKRALPWLALLAVALGIGLSIAWRFRPRIRIPEFDRQALRMEVLNACGEPKVAGAVRDELQARGYNVYSTGTAPERLDRTTVVDLRDPTGANAQLVARVLGLEAQRRIWDIPLGSPVLPAAEVALDSARYLELRLVVGGDWRQFFPQSEPLR